MIKQPKREQPIILTVGSKYIIRSLETKDSPLITIGIFKGYTVIGGDDAICIELDEMHEKMAGKLRIIPCHMIMAIDVMEAAKPETPAEEEAVHRYFG